MPVLPNIPCTPGKDDAKCLKQGYTQLMTSGSCPFPYSNDANLPGYDTVVRRSTGFCRPDKLICGCTVFGLGHQVLIDACDDIIARQNSSWHTMDACAAPPIMYCDWRGPTLPDKFDGTDIDVHKGHRCKNGEIDPQGS
ncbi:unnamed protein product [Zymoseptoria tritici ST99CH_1A5]|uniref:Uncharacterized protein n=2 Tax=Zymoseptoria tritici TaxID=1047171 RepID=A0A1X7RFK1_ZYMT9|nr:unnamed protein product [Zymoseptoria tritici ST99CH_3D7]SMY19883.1 unnamed protein product [Zymoseptoria tritici ST99CH_1A5]